MANPILIVGAGGHAVSCADVLLSLGYEIVGIISPTPPVSKKLISYPNYINIDDAASVKVSSFCLAIGHNYVRSVVGGEIIDKFGVLSLPPIAHPSAHISPSAELGPGVIVMPKAVIGADVKIDLGCLVNTGASIDHESLMNDFSSMAPGVCTGGNVSIGARAAICLGAHIVNNVSIGSDTVVGASSLLLRDVGSLSVFYGSPARYIRPRSPTDPYM